MSRLNYKDALDSVLAPLGFEGVEDDTIGKRERYWVRFDDGFREIVFLQYSHYLGMTANLGKTDLETERIWMNALGHPYPSEASPSAIFALDNLSSIAEAAKEKHDHWFKNDPNGPAALAQMLTDHLESFMGSGRALEEQAIRYGRGLPPRGDYCSLIKLAITLYRMGEFDEAIVALNPPPRRTANRHWLKQLETARAWLQPRIIEAKATQAACKVS